MGSHSARTPTHSEDAKVSLPGLEVSQGRGGSPFIHPQARGRAQGQRQGRCHSVRDLPSLAMAWGRLHGGLVLGVGQLVLKEVLSSALRTGLCFMLGYEFTAQTKGTCLLTVTQTPATRGLCGLCPPLGATTPTCSLRD